MLIEEWLPIEELGVECTKRTRREQRVATSFLLLHVWWARRPLTVSRAAVLASLLPHDFPHNDFMKLIGITGDPLEGRRKIDEVLSGKRAERVKDPYGYPRAFTYTPNKQELMQLRASLAGIWRTPEVTVLDSFAGGGSIPFEATRLGLKVISNELNPVASVIERATIEYPAKFSSALGKEIEDWGKIVEHKISDALSKCFPKNPGEENLCYIWVHTVQCPECHLVVPLSPSWWLDKKGKLGYRPVLPRAESNKCSFKIVTAGTDGFDPSSGSLSFGKGQCVRCRTPLEGEYIKGEALGGKMGNQLVAIGYKSKTQKRRQFREVTNMDLDGVQRAERLLKEKRPAWEAQGLVPNETIPEGSKTSEPRRSGILRWCDFFSPRQLLVHLTTLEIIRSLPIETELDEGRARAVKTYLAMVLDKGLNYNALFSLWHPTRVAIANVFDRHDFAFIWSYGEIDGSGQLWRWALNQIVDAYEGLGKLLLGVNVNVNSVYLCGDAASLPSIRTASIPCVVIDPPYSDNVMYAELSDYFYVWMKRVIGDVYPELFSTMLTNKDSEAVANKARFRDFKGSQRELAQRDYEAKMTSRIQRSLPSTLGRWCSHRDVHS